MNKIRFVVVDENVFGYINPGRPNTIGVLSTSILRGAYRTWKDGPIDVPMDRSHMRPARLDDFRTFRIALYCYDDDPDTYEIPTEDWGRDFPCFVRFGDAAARQEVPA